MKTERSAKILLLSAAGVALSLSAPVSARDHQLYIELDAGVAKPDKTGLDIGTSVQPASVEHKIGYDFGGIVGYDLGMFRLEVEASVRKANPKFLTSTVRLPNGGPLSLANPGIAGTFIPEGDVKAQSIMANALIDIGRDDNVQFFVGGGVGFARVRYNYSINSAGPGWLSDSAGNGTVSSYGAFAWQALAGLRAPISRNFDVGMKYRFFNVGGPSSGRGLIDTSGRVVDPHNFSSHSLMASVTYNFSGTAR
jgi:OmpA-OmpF porin, OOP family